MPKGKVSFVMKLLPRVPGYVRRIWPDASAAASSCRKAYRNMVMVGVIRLIWERRNNTRSRDSLD